MCELIASPNPTFGDFDNSGTLAKLVQPCTHALEAGKNTYVYDAHTYHTKVPPEGIETLIEHYTREDDVVLDPFCGSGMTGIAATRIGRKALLSDLSPAATFIAHNLNTPINASDYLQAVQQILNDSLELEYSLYSTHCRTCNKRVSMLYTVWSYGMLCNHCGEEFILWDVARDERDRIRDSKILAEFPCPSCHKWVKKRGLKRTRRYPVAVGYKCCRRGAKECTAKLDEYDLALVTRIQTSEIPPNLWYPQNPFPQGINTKQPINAGITTIDKAYTPRALWAMAHLWNAAQTWRDEVVRDKLLFTVTSLYQRVTVFSEFRFWGGSGNTANYNVPAIMNEQNVFRAFARKANTISWYFKAESGGATFREEASSDALACVFTAGVSPDDPHLFKTSADSKPRHVRVSCQSACQLPQLKDKSVDYIFTDPPFGSNINYSEMNFLWESWLQTFTNNCEEAIINSVQNKGMQEYENLLCRAFTEARRVLKDEGWLTIVFHNSSKAVWDALQQAIFKAGFSIEGTQTFDKKHGTFKQFVSSNAVGYDLVIHCRKGCTAHSASTVHRNNQLDEISTFIKNAIAQNPDRYVVRYLHVTRLSEFDYRRLYADWLAYSLPSGPTCGFETFRKLVDTALSDFHLPQEHMGEVAQSQ